MTHTLTDYIRSQGALLATLLLLIAIPSWGDTADNTSKPTLLVLGDSLSAGYGLSNVESGWVSLLQAEVGMNYRVVNASISGETSAGGLTRLPALLKAHNPSVMIVELGGNDGLRGYSLSQLRKQLSDIITLAQQQDAAVLLMEMQIPPNYGKRYTEKFTHLYTSLAEEHQAQLIPFFLSQLALQEGMMQADGIHPTEAAQPFMKDAVLTGLKKLNLAPSDN
ncbi:esterase TesA [Simiduia litorea]|uniref:arylesterase n=1 Tax=Simiduia litorea TaxID=1435348 RepID=UPI0036F265A9